MASEVKTNKISPATSTTVTLGDASDLFQLPASAEIDIASGATLDVNGTIDLTGATKTGFPGGLDNASQWRLTANFSDDATPINANLEQVDLPVGFGVLGSSMTQSSGVFTFPSTGYWLISFNAQFYSATTSVSNYFKIQTCIDNTAGPTFADASIGCGAFQGTQIANHAILYIFDVTNTTECKCRFVIGPCENGAQTTTMGETYQNETSMAFLKLADT